VVLKSDACHDVAERSMIDEQVTVTIEAVSIEFTYTLVDTEEKVTSELFSSVTLEAAGIHGPTKVSVAMYCMRSPCIC
jgi:hypothetical protein